MEKRAKRWNFAWTIECASVLFAIANLAALVAVLKVKKDQPLPNWPPLLGINALISIFGALMKVGLVSCVAECMGELKRIHFEELGALSDFDRFDEATRGPWGALKLLFKSPLNLVAMLGAAITIIAIAADPFTQQVLKFYGCSIIDESQTASIVRSNNYTIGVASTASEGMTLDPKMTGALYQGLLNPFPNATSAVSMSCSSGNCTFSETDSIAYSTLAMCSSIQDISSTVTGNGTLGQTMNETGNWSYTLPSGLKIISPYALATAEVLSVESYLGPRPVFQFEILAITTNCPNGYSNNDVAKLNESGRCRLTPFAAHVSLTPCILTYGNVGVEDGTFHQNVRDTTLLK